MSLLAPFFLLLLALGLVVLQFHIRQHRTLSVPSLMIWKRLANDGKGGSRTLRWPRLSLPLALQLLTVLALALALSQPLWGADRDVEHWIYVLDNSASMQTGTGGVSRRDAAIEQLRQGLSSDAGGARFSLIAAGMTATPEFARQRFQPKLFDAALTRLSPEDGPADWAGAAILVRTLARADEITHLVILSDAPVPADFGAELPELRRTDMVMGAPLANAGLTATLTPTSSNGLAWTLSGSIAFSGGMTGTTLTVTLTPEGEQTPIPVASVEIMKAVSGGATAFAYDLTLAAPGLVTLSLADDAARFDNTAFFLARAASTSLDVLYLGSGEQPLIRALGAVEGVSVQIAATLPEDAERFGLVVVDGMEIARAPQTNVVWIGNARLAGQALPSPLAAPAPTGWRGDHPLASDLAWSQLSVDAAVALPAAADADILLEAGNAALVMARTTQWGREVRLAFDPRQSNWPEQAGLAIFATNLVQWLGPMPGQALEPTCVVAQSCLIDARLVGGTIRRLDQPGDRAQVLAANFVPKRAGFYQLEHDGRTMRLAINAPAGAESDVSSERPIDEEPMPAPPVGLWPWLLAVVAIALVVEAWAAGFAPKRLSNPQASLAARPWQARRAWLIALRALALICAVLAFVDMPLPFYRTDQTIIAVAGADGSSLADLAKADLNVGIVSLAGSPVIVRDVDRTQNASPTGVFTGGGVAGLLLAASLLPSDGPGHILAQTTASQSPESLATLAGALRDRGIVVDALASPAAKAGDVMVEVLHPTSPIYAGDSFPVTGIVRASAPVTAEITFSRDSVVLSQQSMTLQAGANRIETMITDVEPGEALYEISVAVSTDPEPGNNRNGVVISARPSGTIAVVAAEPNQGESFAHALRSQGLQARVIAPSEVPGSIEGWLDYDGAVLMNVPAIAMTTPQQDLIETAVAKHGMGLLVLGGANSFGPGGYLETALDRISPISSRVPRDKPRVALAFVLDRSSSMKQPVGDLTRLDVAKQATLSAIRLLNEESQVAVVTFDSSAQLALRLRSVQEADAITDAINQIGPGGGTAMYRGLAAGLNQLRNADASARHIVVMTDGLSQAADFAGLIAQMREVDITVSSVSIGSEAETELVEEIASLGGGSFYATTDFGALPSILSQEAMMLSGSPLEIATSEPHWIDRDVPFLAGMPASLPPIEGFVLTTPKPDARMLMMVDDAKGDPMPLLAYWRYGNGQVLALTTDAAGDWSRHWQYLPDYPRLWAQALRQFLPVNTRPELTLSSERVGDTILLSIESGQASSSMPTLSVMPAEGPEIALPLHQTAPGRYAAEFVPSASGNNFFRATRGAESAQLGVYLAFPARLDRFHPDPGPAQIASATGGKLFAPGEPYVIAPFERWVGQSVWPFWTGLALLLFMLELTLRYTRVLGDFWRSIRQRARPLRSTEQSA